MPATGAIVLRSALRRLIRLPVTKVKLPPGSWSMLVIEGISAWSRSPTIGSRLRTTLPGGVTVSVAALLGVVLWPLQLSVARNCAPLSPSTVDGKV